MCIRDSATAIESAVSGDSLGTVIKKAAVSTVVGAIGGAVAASGLGVLTQSVVGAGLGALETAGQAVVCGEKVNAKAVLISAVNGAAGGIAGGNGAAYGSKFMKHYRTQAVKHLKRNGLGDAAKYLWRNTWKWAKKQLTKSTAFGVVKGFVGNKIMNKINSYASNSW